MSSDMHADVVVDVDNETGIINPMIYGHYVEHVADCVYPAISDEGSPVSDERGLRRDVIKATAELGSPVVRWPGGCFADTYHWVDGVGPRDQRPIRRNWHWGGLEPNTFGTDEFLSWCEQVGAAPYVNLNLGTGTLDEALRWVDYCLGTDDTEEVARRKANGRIHPYEIGLWGIGNETWGSWEAGTMPADHYARILANWADFLKRYQPSASVIGVGSSEGADADWDRTVLRGAGRYLDYLSNHVYGYSADRVTGSEYLSVAFTPVYFEARLRAMADRIAEYRAEAGGESTICISLDEWNIRHYELAADGTYELNRSSPRTMQDAIFVSGVLNSMVRMSPIVGMANYVFLVNGNAVLNVWEQDLVRTTIYYVFLQFRKWMVGTAVSVDVRSPSIETPSPQANEPGHQPICAGLPPRSSYLDAAAAVDGDYVTISLVNRHQDKSMTVSVAGEFRLRESWTFTHEDIYAVNDFENPNRVLPRVREVAEETTQWSCPPHSVTLLRGKRLAATGKREPTEAHYRSSSAAPPISSNQMS